MLQINKNLFKIGFLAIFMRFAIAYSKLDLAGTNIIERLNEMGFLPQFPIIELKKLPIYSDDLIEKNYPELRNIDFIIFATTHRSVKGEASLSVHAPGNWRDARLGGKPGKVCKTSAFVLKYLFQELNKNLKNSNLKEKYKATMEITHHGPLIDLPCCFIEIGSSEEQWRNTEAGKIIAQTILSLQNFNEKNLSWIPAIGIGGPHYSPNFNKIQLNSSYAISHIIPEYALPLTSPSFY